MKKITGLLLGSYLLFGGLGIAAAQEAVPPPKVLSVIREYVKPGKGGALHERDGKRFRAGHDPRQMAHSLSGGEFGYRQASSIILDRLRFLRSLGERHSGDAEETRRFPPHSTAPRSPMANC